MAGYPGTPLAAKIGVKAGQRVMLIGAPRDWSIDDLPSKVRVIRRRSNVAANITIVFMKAASSLDREIASLCQTITPDGSLWIAWPRRAGGHRSDLTDHAIRIAVLPLGLVDVKVAALDDDWSALKFVWRKDLRANLS